MRDFDYKKSLGQNFLVDENVKKKIVSSANIDEKSFPKKAIDMLIEIMGVTEEEIVEWYINKIDINIIREGIKDSLRNIFNIQKEIEKKTENGKEVAKVTKLGYQVIINNSTK